MISRTNERIWNDALSTKKDNRIHIILDIRQKVIPTNGSKFPTPVTPPWLSVATNSHAKCVKQQFSHFIPL